MWSVRLSDIIVRSSLYLWPVYLSSCCSPPQASYGFSSLLMYRIAIVVIKDAYQGL